VRRELSCEQTILPSIGSRGQPLGPHVRRSRRRAGPGARSAEREHAGRVATFNRQGTQSNANDGVDRIGGQNALDPAIELRFARARARVCATSSLTFGATSGLTSGFTLRFPILC